MGKRFFGLVVLLVFGSGLVLAQAVRVGKGRTLTPEKAKARSAITVIDLRNVLGDKKPPKREADSTFSMRMMTGPRTGGGKAGLQPRQLGEALQTAGLAVQQPNVYARFTPERSQVPGRGYMFLLYPAAVYPDRVEFQSSSRGDPSRAENGALVVLREQGTYVLDFLVEFPGVPAGMAFQCVILRGSNTFHMKVVQAEAGPQHILVITNQDAEYQALDDWHKSVGIRCLREGAGSALVPWTLYLVDVNRL